MDSLPLPPWAQVWDMLRLVVLPTAGVSLLLMLAVRRLGGERLSPLATLLAVSLALIVGNYFREAMPWRLESERPLTCTDLTTALAWSLEGKPPPVDPESPPPTDELPLPPARYWLPWLALAALVLESLLGASRLPPGFTWCIRTLLVVLAGRLLVPPTLRSEAAWTPWVLSATMLTEWGVLAGLARRWKDGTLPTALVLTLSLAGGLMLYAHSARLMDMSLLAALALIGPAAVAWKWPADAAPALAFASVFLPGLMLTGQHETFSEVPLRSFVLAGLAPLALVPMLLPYLSRQERWARWLPALLLPLLPALFALWQAMQVETLEFE